MKKRAFQLLKLIGVVLFLWILLGVDRASLLLVVRDADPLRLTGSFVLIFAMYGVKTIRWRALVGLAGVRSSYLDAWRIYNIGVFLSLITPAKLGEFGRAAYLRKRGMTVATALTLTVIDRLADVAVIGILAIAGVGILFGMRWAASALAAGILASVMTWILWKRTHARREQIEWLRFVDDLTQARPAAIIFCSTIASWFLYFLWAILIARSVGITAESGVLIAVLALTGIIALFPIAPSGLGTREAALLTLLGPFGVQSELAVALGLLMFLSIMLSGLPGGWYWITASSGRPPVD